MRLVSCLKVCLMLALAVAQGAAVAQSFPSLTRTIELARQEAYRGKDVDWPAVQSKAEGIAGADGEDAAIRHVLKALGDGHSSYRPPSGRESSPGGTTKATGPSAAETGIVESVGPIEGVPVLRINAWSGSPEAARTAVANLRDRLAAGLETQSCGVVLDFSRNPGGNMWPMLVGLAPLLTEGPLGYFRDRSGAEQAIEKRDGAIFLAGKPHYLNMDSDKEPAGSVGHVGVVIGPRTSSSGEITAIMFLGQGNTRFFGAESSGYSTANRVHRLPNGGSIALTTGVTLDRNRHEHARIKPDVVTEAGIRDAAHWVRSQCGRETS